MKKQQMLLWGGGVLAAFIVGFLIYRKTKKTTGETTTGTGTGKGTSEPTKMTQEEADKLASKLNISGGRMKAPTKEEIESKQKTINEITKQLKDAGYKPVGMPGGISGGTIYKAVLI